MPSFTNMSHLLPLAAATPKSITRAWPVDKADAQGTDDVIAEEEESYSEISRQMTMLSVIEDIIINLSPPALGLLNVLSIFSPNHVAESVLKRHLPSDGVLQYPVSHRMYIVARDELLRASLIKWQWNGTEYQLLIHKDVHDANQCSMTTEEYHDSFDTAVLLISRGIPQALSEDTRFLMTDTQFEQFAQMLPLVISLHQRFSDSQRWDPPVHIQRDLVWLLQRTGVFLLQTSRPGPSKILLDLALAIAEDHYTEMLDLQSDILYCLARCGTKLNTSPQLIHRYSEKHLFLCHDMDNGSLARRMDLCNAHVNMAQAYLLLKDYVSALEECRLCREVLDTLKYCSTSVSMRGYATIFEGWAMLGLDKRETEEE